MNLAVIGQKDGGVEECSIAIVEDLHHPMALGEPTDCVYKFLRYWRIVIK